MFFYIYFLRPPLLEVLPSSPVIITPQISNDLRTESFEDSQDLFYSWSPAASSEDNFLNATKPVKLTTWRQANAYKEITVPSPPGIRDGQSWRLILSSEPQRYSINLEEVYGAESFGQAPFPVISMPIQFKKNANQNRGKQEKIERHYDFTVQNIGQSRVDLALRITEQTSFDLDKKIWDSGIGLSSWLVSLAGKGDTLSSAKIHLRRALFSSTSKIIELGAGTGVVALTLGALRSVFIGNEDEVDNGCLITTDLPSAMPLLEYNCSVNSHLFGRPNFRPKPEVLDWDAELPPYTEALRGHLDAIIMADVTYNTTSFPALIQTLARLITLNPIDKPPLILLGYKERDATERCLWTMVTEIGIHLERVGERPGAGGAPVEVWVGNSRHHNSISLSGPCQE
ncbi:putative methyltransferase-domain-containing protein [Lentinula aciculospora]|uniref:Methyltransferase-domain-containing protein n=1 Tax=Lentinula aciculospora TaxID=153920 RepID=A0A9W8ZYA9_9AGAR|nr:putative methyltransferase-domain-containing protein [Lentinula aciculospora]